MDVREKLVELIHNADNDKNLGWYDLYDLTHEKTGCAEYFADYLMAHGVTVQEQNGKGCPYCDIAKANEGVINTALWVKEPETSKWTMMGKRLKFCPMCGRKLPQPPKGE